MESIRKSQSAVSRKLVAMCLLLALVACLFVGESLAGKGKGEDDIILYNGNIVLRGGGGKGKGKGRGNIVVANSPQHSHHEYMPMYEGGHHWGGEGFRR